MYFFIRSIWYQSLQKKRDHSFPSLGIIFKLFAIKGMCHRSSWDEITTCKRQEGKSGVIVCCHGIASPLEDLSCIIRAGNVLKETSSWNAVI